MSAAFALFGLLWGALVVLFPGRRCLNLRRSETLGVADPHPRRFRALFGLRKPDTAPPLHEMSLMVAQLSALLRAGRAPAAMWQQAASSVRGGDKGEAATILDAAGRAAALGLPVGPAIRRAALGSDVQSRKVGAPVFDDLAVCLEVAEATGCPLAVVLDRLASHLEDDADAAAARATALAGPKATAQILSVLPLVGLAVGALMGADPLRVLLETPLGILCLASGIVLTLAGRMWSARLVVRAGELR